MPVLSSDSLTVTIKTLGAELCSIKNSIGTEFIWPAKADVWPRHAPVLFPLVGKLRNNKYTYNNCTYNMNQHGFARDMLFDVIEETSQKCTLELKSSAATQEFYPFDFSLQIIYTLSNNLLNVRYTVTNLSKEIMPFSIGAHPGFNCPLLNNESFEDYYLEFEKNEFNLTALNNGLRLDKKNTLFLQNNRLSLSSSLFDNDALVFEGNQINSLSLCSIKSTNKITLSSKGWPYYGIWSKKGCREFICLEPWYGIADSEHGTGNLWEKDGIIKLPENEGFHAEYTLLFSW